MGRTPKRNKDGGRDHYGELTPLLLAGGGLKMGQVIGQSDRTRPPDDRAYAPTHLMATIMHTLFDVGQLRLETGAPSELLRFIEASEPIAELFA